MTWSHEGQPLEPRPLSMRIRNLANTLGFGGEVQGEPAFRPPNRVSLPNKLIASAGLSKLSVAARDRMSYNLMRVFVADLTGDAVPEVVAANKGHRIRPGCCRAATAFGEQVFGGELGM